MSYILEALKKSERQRTRDVVPNLRSLHETVVASPPRPVPWAAVVVLVLAVNALVLAWLFIPATDSEDAGSAPVAVVPDVAVKIGEAAHDAASTAPDPGIAIPVINTARESAVVEAKPVRRGDGMADHGRAAGARVAPVRTTPGTQPDAASQGLAGSRELAAAAAVTAPVTVLEESGRVYRQDENSEPPWLDNLPDSFRADLPAMDISIHAYAARPGARLVRINGRIYREGEEIAEDLLLQAITEEGMILEHRGQRFRMYVVGR